MTIDSTPTPPADPDRRAALRQQTLGRVGEVAVNPEPLLAVLHAPADDPDAVARALERCPALTARLLSTVNSAAFRTSRPIDSLHRAVIHLGASRARALAMAFGLRVLTSDSGLPQRVAQRLWVASLRKAAAARLACRILCPRHADAAFCAALMQDVALPMLVAVDPSFYTHELLPGPRGSWAEQEAQRFGLHHAELGRDLLASWNAAPLICDVVLHHHQPPTGPSDTVAMQLRVATYLASLLPHIEEEPTGPERDWLTALHAQFLAPTYETPDRFLQAAAAEAAPLHTGGDHAVSRSTLVHQLVRAVAGDTLTMVTQLCRLETSLVRQRVGFDELRFHAFTDALTKVLNRRGFLQLAERRVEEAAQRKIGVCCIAIDLDDFKPVNDRYGHDAGDLVLRGLAKLLRRNLDRSDLIGRLGGDEFVVLITGVDRERARQIAQRLAQACIGTRIRLADDVTTPLKLSLGAVHAPELDEGVEVEDLIAAADEMLYHRKRAGKSGLSFANFHPQTFTRAG